MSLAHLYRFFPNLAGSSAERKSDPTYDYNCIAWAANVTTIAWWPRKAGFYWPLGVLADDSLEAFVQAFQTIGYESCDDGDLEPRHEKVAIYTFNNQVKHMARQLPSGQWTSKLGPAVDIEHELDDLTSNYPNGYGEVSHFMRRLIEE